MGKNPIQRIGYGNVAGLLLIAISVMLATSIVSVGQIIGTGSGQASSTILNTICSVFNTIKSVIFILGLALMVLGGAVYAGANLMPSQSRGAFQGYGMAMVIGGIIGVAIAVAAPFILNTIVSASGGSGQQIVSSSGSVSGLLGGTSGVNAADICAGTSLGSVGGITLG